jgi:hypothetical protein
MPPFDANALVDWLPAARYPLIRDHRCLFMPWSVSPPSRRSWFLPSFPLILITEVKPSYSAHFIPETPRLLQCLQLESHCVSDLCNRFGDLCSSTLGLTLKCSVHHAPQLVRFPSKLRKSCPRHSIIGISLNWLESLVNFDLTLFLSLITLFDMPNDRICK